MCYNINMVKENKIEVRIIKYDSDNYIANGKYSRAIFETLKESGAINLSKQNCMPNDYPKRPIVRH